MVNAMFLSALQFSVFDEFDPRGDETLVAMQERLAQQYLPKGNMPDPSDLSPLLAVFQEHGSQSMSAHSSLWSEILSAMVYEKFRKTDLRDREKVHRLGRGIRDLFLRPSRDGGSATQQTFAQEIQSLCETDYVTSSALKFVYRFDEIE